MSAEKLFEKHGRGLLFFSAGKDSLATLLLLRMHWQNLDVVWVNPGAAPIEVIEYMETIKARVPYFHEFKGDQPAWVAAHGWPVDTVPVRWTTRGAIGAGEPVIKFQPSTECCDHNLWQPMQEALTKLGHSLVIYGQRQDETLRNRLRNQAIQDINGRTFFHPINAWTSEMVWEYLRSWNVPMPPGYTKAGGSSIDCWNCTAYLDHNLGRLRELKSNSPGRYAVIEAPLRALRRKLIKDAEALAAFTED